MTKQLSLNINGANYVVDETSCREGLTFYRSYIQAIARLSRITNGDAEQTLGLVNAILVYAISGQDPSDSLNDLQALVFDNIKPNIAMSLRKSEAGKKGGSKQSGSKRQAEPKQTASTNEATCRDTCMDTCRDMSTCMGRDKNSYANRDSICVCESLSSPSIEEKIISSERSTVEQATSSPNSKKEDEYLKKEKTSAKKERGGEMSVECGVESVELSEVISPSLERYSVSTLERQDLRDPHEDAQRAAENLQKASALAPDEADDIPLCEAEEESPTEIGFRQFWDSYGKKVDRARAWAQWLKMSDKDRVSALVRVDAYIEATPDVRYRKYPSAWLEGRNWEDDFETMKSTYNQLNKQNSNEQQPNNRSFAEIESQRVERERERVAHIMRTATATVNALRGGGR